MFDCYLISFLLYGSEYWTIYSQIKEKSGSNPDKTTQKIAENNIDSVYEAGGNFMRRLKQNKHLHL